MIEQQMPFRRILLTSDTFQILKEGQIISTFNKCGIFYCQRGSVEVSLEGCHYHIKPGDVYIYMASTLVHLLHKSEDAEGIMVEVDFYYILPIVNKVINVESQLFMRKNPCVSLSGEQCAHFEYLLNNLWDRINAEDCQKENVQYQHLKLELIKSMGQTICYEILNMYFTNQPLQPLQQGKKDVVFQNSCCLCSVSIARNVTSLFMQGCSISLPVISRPSSRRKQEIVPCNGSYGW